MNDLQRIGPNELLHPGRIKYLCGCCDKTHLLSVEMDEKMQAGNANCHSICVECNPINRQICTPNE